MIGATKHVLTKKKSVLCAGALVVHSGDCCHSPTLGVTWGSAVQGRLVGDQQEQDVVVLIGSDVVVSDGNPAELSKIAGRRGSLGRCGDHNKFRLLWGANTTDMSGVRRVLFLFEWWDDCRLYPSNYYSNNVEVNNVVPEQLLFEQGGASCATFREKLFGEEMKKCIK